MWEVCGVGGCVVWEGVWYRRVYGVGGVWCERGCGVGGQGRHIYPLGSSPGSRRCVCFVISFLAGSFVAASQVQ